MNTYELYRRLVEEIDEEMPLVNIRNEQANLSNLMAGANLTLNQRDRLLGIIIETLDNHAVWENQQTRMHTSDMLEKYEAEELP